MKVYLYIAKQKKTLKMYLPYIEALGKKLDITHNLADADIVMILGAWTMQGAQLAGKSRHRHNTDGEELSRPAGLEQEHRPDQIFRLQSSHIRRRHAGQLGRHQHLYPFRF